MIGATGQTADPWRYECNTGGPRSRVRREPIKSTVLGNPGGHIVCPRRRHAGLKFPDGTDPVEQVLKVLASCGFATAESAKSALRHILPPGRLVAAPSKVEPILVATPCSARRAVLVEALVLGLCTANLYDPARPVLWTQASLTRRLELFDMGGFYATD